MTTKQTDAATRDAKPAHGDVLLYVDWQGNKIYGQETAPSGEKKGKPNK